MPTPLINIASQPFRRERAQNALYGLICLFLLCTLIAAVSVILHQRVRAADLRHTIGQQQAQLRGYQQAQAQWSTVVAQPKNADVFATSVFLNELIARRSVSWTHVFGELETLMPTDMRLISIRLPQLSEEGGSGRNQVQLDMVVGTDQPKAILELLERLQKSSLFGAATVVNQTPPTQNDPQFHYRVNVAYAQKL